MKRPLPFGSNAVWPSLGWVAVFGLVYAMLDGGLWLIEHSAPSLSGQLTGLPEVMNIRAGILATAAGFYALYRLWRFHPACNSAYAAWLKTSPWTPQKPLPLGPVHPVWQDVVVLGAMTLFAQWYAHVDPALPVIVFGLVYLFAMTLLLAVTRTWIPCLLLGFIWPAPALPMMRGWPTLGILAALVAVIWYGHRKSLHAFPWKRTELNRPESRGANQRKSIGEIEIRVDGLSNTPAVRNPNLGWPFLWLSPKFECNSVSSSTSFFVSALIGWWTYCAIVGFEIPSSPAAILLFAAMAAMVRFAIYCSGLGPSFNLWGRLVTGRIIVPGFDQFVVTPLLVLALAIAGGVAIRHSASCYPMASACVVGLICFALLAGGPTMRKWMLTGQHRYRSPTRLGTNKQLLRPI
jgi:hypothetical protein